MFKHISTQELDTLQADIERSNTLLKFLKSDGRDNAWVGTLKPKKHMLKSFVRSPARPQIVYIRKILRIPSYFKREHTVDHVTCKLLRLTTL